MCCCGRSGRRVPKFKSVTNELTTLLPELYAAHRRSCFEPSLGRGQRPLLGDAELLGLAVAQMLLGFDCERRWIRHGRHNDLRVLFPLPTRTIGRTTNASGRHADCCARHFTSTRGSHRPGSPTCESPTPPGSVRMSQETIALASGPIHNLSDALTAVRPWIAFALARRHLPGTSRRRPRRPLGQRRERKQVAIAEPDRAVRRKLSRWREVQVGSINRPQLRSRAERNALDLVPPDRLHDNR